MSFDIFGSGNNLDKTIAKYDKPSNDFNGSSAAINININIGDFHLDGGFNFDKKNPQNDLEMAIRKVTKDS